VDAAAPTAPAEAAVAPTRYLLVCSGNTCRSPMAEALLADLLARRGEAGVVHSCGTGAADGEPASVGAVGAMRVLSEEGTVSPDALSRVQRHRSAGVSPAAVAGADVILTMGASHRDSLFRIFGAPALAHARVLQVSEFGRYGAAGRPATFTGRLPDVADPFMRPLADYVATARQLHAALADGLAGGRRES